MTKHIQRDDPQSASGEAIKMVSPSCGTSSEAMQEHKSWSIGFVCFTQFNTKPNTINM
jgi:hypothetical protein